MTLEIAPYTNSLQVIIKEYNRLAKNYQKALRDSDSINECGYAQLLNAISEYIKSLPEEQRNYIWNRILG